MAALKKLGFIEQIDGRPPKYVAVAGDLRAALPVLRETLVGKPSLATIIREFLEADGGFYTAREIAQLLGRKLYAVVTVVSRLEAAGVVKRYHSEPEPKFAATVFRAMAA